MTLMVESHTGPHDAASPNGLGQSISQSIRDITKLRAAVQCVAPGALPNDGKVIEDTRSYQ